MATWAVRIVFVIVLLGSGTLGVVLLPAGSLVGWSLLGLSIGLCAWWLVATRLLFGLPRAGASSAGAGSRPPSGHRTTEPAIVVSPPAEAAVADLSTVEICAAWRLSYFELLRAVDTSVRERLVGLRQEYLDELERRDSARFALWLANGARAGSDPRRYLTSDSS